MTTEEFKKLTPEERKKVKFKDLPKFNKRAIYFLGIVVLIILVNVFVPTKTNEKPIEKKWEQMTSAEQDSTLMAQVKADQLNVTAKAHVLAKQLAKFPEEVEFKYNDVYYVDQIATKRMVIKGDMICKNAFGVKVSCEYWCKFAYRGKDSMEVLDIKLYEK